MLEKRPMVGVGVLFIRDEKILLGLRKGKDAHGIGTYGSCGGHLEFGETLEQCAIRETMEESGLIIKNLEFLCVSNVIAYGKHFIDFEFLAEIEDADPQVTEEVEEWGWYNLEDLPSPIFQPIAIAIASYRNGKRYNP